MYKVYAVYGCGSHDLFSKMSIDEIVNPPKNEEDEIVFALQECIDCVLDLRVNESFRFQPNRDDIKSYGIITRIK